MNGFTRFVNDMEMVSFSSFVRTIGWIIASVTFTVSGCVLLLSGDEKLIAWGFQIAIVCFGGLGIASGIGAVNTRTVRTSAKEYAPIAEAKERARIAAGPAVNAQTIQKVEVQPTNGPLPYTGEAHEEEHQWRDRKNPTEGLG